MEHAVHPTDFVEKEPLKDLIILILYSFQATAGIGILTKIFQLNKGELCFLLAETNDSFLLSCLLQEA